MNFIPARFRRKPSTDSAIAGITKALDQLDAVVAAEEEEINALDAAIEEAARDRLAAFSRRDRAAGIAKRFNDLVA